MKEYLAICITKDKSLAQSIHGYGKYNKFTMLQIIHLENSLVMYGIYNSDTQEHLTDTVHR